MHRQKTIQAHCCKGHTDLQAQITKLIVPSQLLWKMIKMPELRQSKPLGPCCLSPPATTHNRAGDTSITHKACDYAIKMNHFLKITLHFVQCCRYWLWAICHQQICLWIEAKCLDRLLCQLDSVINTVVLWSQGSNSLVSRITYSVTAYYSFVCCVAHFGPTTVWQTWILHL